MPCLVCYHPVHPLPDRAVIIIRRCPLFVHIQTIALPKLALHVNAGKAGSDATSSPYILTTFLLVPLIPFF
jgi:hypothetical protein